MVKLEILECKKNLIPTDAAISFYWTKKLGHCRTGQNIPLGFNFLNGPPSASFSILQQINVINVNTVSGTEIWTHNLLFVSLFLYTQDQGSHPIIIIPMKATTLWCKLFYKCRYFDSYHRRRQLLKKVRFSKENFPLSKRVWSSHRLFLFFFVTVTTIIIVRA